MFLARAGAQRAWTPPVAISAGAQGWEAAAAIDANGDSVAIWDEISSQAHIWARTKPGANPWGPVALVSPALQTVNVFPAVRISAAGFATAVWTDANGVWTADRPAGAGWNAPQLLIPLASSPIFVMDAQGDAAVAWTLGGATSAHSSVMAVLRPAGGLWTVPQTVATGVHLQADHAGIGGNGAAIVTWESYSAFCSDGFCELSNFVQHASRQAAGTGAWVDSGPLLGPADEAHNAFVALDSTGRAILVALTASGAYVSATQGDSGGAWSPFNVAVNPQSISIVSDLASDDAGDVTMVYEAIGFSVAEALAVSGTISANAWSPPVVLSTGDFSISEVHFALASSGAALAVWATNSATPVIQAVTRTTPMGAWTSPVTVSQPGSTEIDPEAAAVNAAGDAIVIYSGYNANDVHTEYASTYTPQ